jgi:hypothetical protein
MRAGFQSDCPTTRNERTFVASIREPTQPADAVTARAAAAQTRAETHEEPGQSRPSPPQSQTGRGHRAAEKPPGASAEHETQHERQTDLSRLGFRSHRRRSVTAYTGDAAFVEKRQRRRDADERNPDVTDVL